jgi:glutamate/tyrosine decarboxylase-like PLP-dependent enzyme
VVDPLREIARICRESGTWFHVDGAYGALAAAADGVPDDLHGMQYADSVAVDPHKWLYAPLEAGCTLVRDPDTLRRAFSYHPPYYHFGQEATNFVDFGPQNSRGFRALKVWLGLRQVGREGYVRMIADDVALARELHELADADPELEARTTSLSVTTFRYVPTGVDTGRPETERYLDELNRDLRDRLEHDGETFLSNAIVDGTYLLRACIVNFRTARPDLEAVLEIVKRTGAALAADRPGPVSQVDL